MSQSSTRHSRHKLTVEQLEGRALLANIFEINSAIIQVERNRLTTKSDLGDMSRSFSKMVTDAVQAASDKARELYNDFFDTKDQEQIDRQNGDKAAVQADRAAEAQDKREYNEAAQVGKEEQTVGDRVKQALNRDARQEDHFSNKDEQAVKNGADPTSVEDKSAAQSNSAEQEGQQAVDKGNSLLDSLKSLTDSLVPGSQPSPTPTPPPGPAGALALPIKLVSVPPDSTLTGHSTSENKDVTFTVQATLNIDSNGAINSNNNNTTFAVEGYQLFDPADGHLIGTVNSIAGSVTGTYKPGDLKSNGNFQYTIQAYDASDGHHDQQTFNLVWQGTITSTLFNGVIKNGSQQIGRFSITLTQKQ